MTDTDVPTVEDPAEAEPRSRRQLLKLAGATVAGGAVMAIAGADPASAADDDPLIIGDANLGSITTGLNADVGTTANPAMNIVNSGTSGNALYLSGNPTGGSGRDLKLNGTGRLAQVHAVTGLAAPNLDIIDAGDGTPVEPAHEIVRSIGGIIWASTGQLAGSNTVWKRINTVRVDTASGSGAAFAPFRFIDTRNGTGGISGVRNVGGTTNWNVTAHASIPDDAVGIMGNLTVTGSNYAGWVNIWPRGVAEPVTSSINFTTGQTIANFFCVGLGTGGNAGQISIGPRKGGGGTGSVHVILDITAYIQ